MAAEERTIASLLSDMQAQHDRMSIKNPAKQVLLQAAGCIHQLALRVVELEQQAQKDESRIVIP